MRMASGDSNMLSPAVGRVSVDSPRRSASIRRWAWVGIAAQVLFVASWLLAASWQGRRYSVIAHSISDMYAVTAPHGSFLVIVFTICGAATICFALRSVWPMLRPGGWAATVSSALLALSILGLGDLLSPAERVDCRMADPGCTAARALSNSGGKLDDTLSSIGLLALVVAGLVLAAAMRRTPGWQGVGPASPLDKRRAAGRDAGDRRAFRAEWPVRAPARSHCCRCDRGIRRRYPAAIPRPECAERHITRRQISRKKRFGLALSGACGGSRDGRRNRSTKLGRPELRRS